MITSPASPALVRQLLLDAMQTEEEREQYARSHGARYLVPHRLVEEKMVTKVGPAMSRELLAYLEAPVPHGQRLLAQLEVLDGALCRRYTAYLAVLREHLPNGRGLSDAEMERLSRQLGRRPRTIREDVVRAESLIVELVHTELMRQIETRTETVETST